MYTNIYNGINFAFLFHYYFTSKFFLIIFTVILFSNNETIF